MVAPPSQSFTKEHIPRAELIDPFTVALEMIAGSVS